MTGLLRHSQAERVMPICQPTAPTSTAPPRFQPHISLGIPPPTLFFHFSSIFHLIFIGLRTIARDPYLRLLAMASLLITRGLHSLIASRDTTLNQNIAWNAISKRNEPDNHTVVQVVFWVLVVVNICILVPVFFTVSISQASTTIHEPPH